MVWAQRLTDGCAVNCCRLIIVEGEGDQQWPGGQRYKSRVKGKEKNLPQATSHVPAPAQNKAVQLIQS